MASPAVDLTVPGLEELGRRRSAKWAGVEPGVLSSTIAETDFPVLRSLGATIEVRLDRPGPGGG